MLDSIALIFIHQRSLPLADCDFVILLLEHEKKQQIFSEQKLKINYKFTKYLPIKLASSITF